jgi:HD-GYP domain-containing protein (c-di-GMP phosphodiesterase class II)
MIRFSKILQQGQQVDLKETIDISDVSLRKTDVLNKEGEKDTINEARAYYEKLFTLANKVKLYVQKNKAINISPIILILSSIIENNLIDSLYYYLVREGDKGNELVAHSVGMTIFSLKIGIGMGYDNKRLLVLAMAAFFHDVGMYKIPRDILNKKGKLSEQELKEIQRHPEMGAEILSKLDDKYRWLADIALQVHERADGSGYPRGLKGDEIHDYAYIIGLVDIYSAMIKDRPYRGRIEQNKAIKSIIASSKGKFPVKMVKVFLNQISFFPINSYVRLNDRSVGRVITTNPNFPLKPTVEILYDSLGNGLKEPRISDLSKQPLLYITGSIDEKDVI